LALEILWCPFSGCEDIACRPPSGAQNEPTAKVYPAGLCIVRPRNLDHDISVGRLRAITCCLPVMDAGIDFRRDFGYHNHQWVAHTFLLCLNFQNDACAPRLRS
jgi:hypothetical protein